MRDLMMKKLRTIALSIWGALLVVIIAAPVLAADITVNLVAEKVSVTMPTTGEVIPMWGYRLAADPAGSATSRAGTTSTSACAP